MPRPRVVVVSVQGRAGLAGAGVEDLERVADVTYVRRSGRMSPGDAVGTFREADVVAVTPKVMPVFDDALLSCLPRLRAVALHATGFEGFDVALLARRGVALRTLATYATESVAAHALGLVLAMSTRLHLAADRSRGLVAPSTSLRGFELAGRTLGVVGLGRIGTRLAGMVPALGMRVVAADVVPRTVPGVTMTTLPRLLARADVVALACPLVAGAPPVLDAAAVAAMRPGAVLVNVGRPELVDGPAVVAALRSGALRGYAVDDVVAGPAEADLVAEGRLLQTGHSAWWTDEALARGSRQWVDSVLRLVNGWPATDDGVVEMIAG
jgi:phosphoglycerate dehydrogenase-like enzyme